MGFLDAILGRSTPPPANLDVLFAVPQAALSLQVEGFVATGQGAVCFRPAEGAATVTTEAQIGQLIATGGGPTVTTTDDPYGFRWLSVTRADASVSGLITDLHAANTSLVDAGFGASLLCSTVLFTLQQQTVALVYLYKRGTFYPFAPVAADRRDNPLELRVRGIIDDDVPVEQDLSRWLAIWGAPGLG